MNDAPSMTDERLYELLGEADPLAGEPAVASWETEVALGRLLALASADAAAVASAPAIGSDGRIPSAPRARWRLRPSRRLLLSGLGVLAAASVAVVLGLPGGSGGTGSGTPSAFADWSPSPTVPASAGQVAAAEAACGRQGAYPGEPGYAGLTPTVVDTRGPWTMLVYIDGTSDQDCVVAPNGTASQTTSRGPERVAVASGTIRWRSAGSGSGMEGYEGHPFSRMDGEVGAGVTAATLVLKDGAKVQTSIANGWFAAWWPGESRVAAAEVSTANGTVTEPLSGSLKRRPRTGETLRELAEGERSASPAAGTSSGEASSTSQAPSTTETSSPAGEPTR